MTPRAKKLFGLAVLPPGLLLYFGAVVTLAEHVPEFWLAKLSFFLVAGIAWAFPVVPFIRWMERDAGRNKTGAERRRPTRNQANGA